MDGILTVLARLLPRRNEILDSIVMNRGVKYPRDKQMSVESFLATVQNGDLPNERFSMNRSAMTFRGSFKTAFRVQFGDTNYQWKLDEHVVKRFQGRDELTSNYVICMQGLYRRFSSPDTL